MLNAGRRYLGIEDLAGKVFVTSGLGGMSGAQAKAAAIVGCIGVIAEVRWGALPVAPSKFPDSLIHSSACLLSSLSLVFYPFLLCLPHLSTLPIKSS